MDTVSVPIRITVFEKLQRLAVLAGDVSSVIERLINHWEGSATSPPMHEGNETGNAAVTRAAFWHSARGEAFPVGLQLRKEYLGKLYEAEVSVRGIVFNGQTYDSPSKAAIAVKHAAGRTGESANTNGWEFWEMFVPELQKWMSIDVLREKQHNSELPGAWKKLSYGSINPHGAKELSFLDPAFPEKLKAALGPWADVEKLKASLGPQAHNLEKLNAGK